MVTRVSRSSGFNVLRQTQTAYNRSSFRKDHRKRSRTANDTFSPKIAWPKLASIADHAGPRCFWRRGDLQRDLHAQRRVCRRLLAETSKLGRRRCLRIHGDQFDRLSLDSLGRVADVLGRPRVSGVDQVYRVKVYGARSWLHLGPINFQPAQLAVVAGIMVLALFLSQFRQMHPTLRLLLCGAIAGAPCLLILMQPDLGEVIIWVPVMFALLFVAGLPLRYLVCIILIAIAFIPIAINFGFKPYQQQRITAFTHPDIDQQGSAWAINQSLIAIGSGGWSGKGFKAPNTQIELGFLPATAVHNDYIFSAVGEQWGFVGGIFLIGAFALLLLTCLFVAFFAGDQLGLLLVIGVTALIFTHIFQNVGMTIAMMPITGVPLPLISYSGSFVLMIMFGLGIVNSVWVHRKVDEIR